MGQEFICVRQTYVNNRVFEVGEIQPTKWNEHFVLKGSEGKLDEKSIIQRATQDPAHESQATTGGADAADALIG
jgi:hypothetical protein